MDQEYDLVVLGTGLKECILSGLGSIGKQRVLHMDRNPYYGGESASLNLEQLYKKFRPGEKVPDGLGKSNRYNVDLCPKFLMACGNLVKVLLHTRVTRYLEFRSVAGSYVYQGSGIHKVPSTAAEALSSSLMSFFQKRKFKNFLNYVSAYDEKDTKTWETKDLSKTTMRQLFDYWQLDDKVRDFTVHAMALYLDDTCLDQLARPTVDRIKLYVYSMSRYGQSPYIYPLYGLGGLPEGFSRLSAIHGGTYMLNKAIEEIVYDSKGFVTGVKSEGKVAACKKLIADPSYFVGTDKIRKIGQVARCICILSHPVDATNGADSCQIIIPAKEQPGRKSDIYCSVVSYHHQVAAEGKYVCVASCPVETKDAKKELEPALKMLGKIDEKFFWVTDQYVPNNDPAKDNCFITSSYDASTHWEAATQEVIDLYARIFGRALDLKISADPEDLKDTGAGDAPAADDGGGGGTGDTAAAAPAAAAAPQAGAGAAAPGGPPVATPAPRQ